MTNIRYYKGKHRVEVLEPSDKMRSQGLRRVKVVEPFTSWELTIHGWEDFNPNRETKTFAVGEEFVTSFQNLKTRKKEQK